MKPMYGEVAADNFVLICVRFTPTARKLYTQLLRCIVNGDSGGRLLLEGLASLPFITFPEVTLPTAGQKGREQVTQQIQMPPQIIPRGFQGPFYLKPTCVGLSSSRTFSLKNGSRIPLRFRLTLPNEAYGVVSVTPMRGLLLGNEVVTLTIAFAPRRAVRYEFKLRARYVIRPICG